MKQVAKRTFWKNVGGFLVSLVLISCAGLALGLWANIGWKVSDQLRELGRQARSSVKAELSPGDLVDKAMAIPGAIVISPHRDLVEMGLAEIRDNPEECDLTLTTGSPAIAVHTKKRWCVWELGEGYLLVHHGLEHCNGVDVWGFDNTFIGGGRDYKLAYDSFTRCVAEGAAYWPGMKADATPPRRFRVGDRLGNAVCTSVEQSTGFCLHWSDLPNDHILSQTTTAQWDYKKTSHYSPLPAEKPCVQGGSLAPGETCYLMYETGETDHSEGIE